MNRHLPLYTLCTAMLVAGAPLAAQTTTTGGLSGRITDASGAPVAGATIRLSSGQISRTVQSTPDGRYSVGLLNAGAWTLSVHKAGYTTQTQVVQVALNSVFQANFRIAKEGGIVVDVVATQSAIDAASTTTGASFNLETLTAIPKGRDFTDLAYMSPGVTTSGFGGDGLNLSINGASGAENSFSVDGLKTNDMRYGGIGVSMVSEFIEQVDVQTGGFKPEYNALGGVFTALTRGGTKTFAGSVWSTFTPKTFRPGPKESPLLRENEAVDRWDVGAWAGGAILPDRLFYSVGANYTYQETPGQVNLSGLGVAKVKSPATQAFSKFNYFLSPNHQLTLSYFGNFAHPEQGRTNTPLMVGDGRGTQDTGATFTRDTNNLALLYDGNLTPTMMLSIKVGQSSIHDLVRPTTPNLPAIGDYLWYDTYEGGQGPGYKGPDDPDTGRMHSRGGYGLAINEKSQNTQFSADYTWAAGNHSLKAGYSHMDSEYALEEHYSGTAGSNPLAPGSFLYNIYPNADGIPVLACYYIQNDAKVKAAFDALYLQDTWQIHKDLNVFYGFRAERQVQKDAFGRTFMKFDMLDYVQPRLGFTWDVLGEGKSKLSGSYAIYYEQIPQRMAIRAFSREAYYRYRFSDAYAGSGFTYDPTASNGIGTWSGKPRVTDYASGFSFPPLMTGLKLPMRWEVQLGYEQQVTETIKVGVNGRYRKLVNAMEDSVILDGDDNPVDPDGKAVIWNPRPGAVGWQSSAGPVRVAQTGFPEAYNVYRALDLTFEYKAARRYLSASYTLSRLRGNYEGLVSASNGQADANITASWDYYPYVGEGLLPLDRTHQFKLYGYQQFTVFNAPLTVGFRFSWMSGTPYSYLDDGSSSTPPVEDIGQYGNAVFQDGKMGNKGRTPSLSCLDLNLEWELALGKRVKLLPSLNVFNVFNARPTTAVQEQATDSNGYPLEGQWGLPFAWQQGRSVRFGAKLRF